MELMVEMLRNLVLVAQDPKEKETSGGIILAEIDTQKAAPRGTVLKVGPQVTEIKKDDRVLWGEYAGQVIETLDNGVVWRVMTEDDILARWED